MDAKTVGSAIAALRRKAGLTQTELAVRLNVSNKTVSKWEAGQGFPEVTQFPVLAELFGVTVDYLMCGQRRGIMVAGNLLTDLVKRIERYPDIGMLSDISSISRAVGGAVPNVGIDLAKIDRRLPLGAIGRVGDDEHGRYVLSQLQQYGIDTSRMRISSTAPTGFSDVMSLPSGERTFFHMRGANDEFCPADVEVSGLGCLILHIGYLMLLAKFDAPDAEYGTGMARFLHDVQAQGIRTSVDAVSNSTADYGAVARPALRWCNYLIVNEIECCGIWGIDPRLPDGTLDPAAVEQAMRLCAEGGVQDKVIVHAKEAGFCLDVASGAFTAVPSLKLPKEHILGSVGAGDAFCAGCLYSLHEGYDDTRMLEFASGAAACNLFAENSVDGMRSREEIDRLILQYPRISL